MLLLEMSIEEDADAFAKLLLMFTRDCGTGIPELVLGRAKFDWILLLEASGLVDSSK